MKYLKTIIFFILGKPLSPKNTNLKDTDSKFNLDIPKRFKKPGFDTSHQLKLMHR